MRARRVSPLVLLSMLFAVQSPLAADLRGTLTGAAELTPAARERDPRRRDFYWEVPNGVVPITTPRADVERDLAVVLTGPGVEESSQPASLVLEGGRCRPGTLVVSPATVINVENTDLLSHELYVVPRGATERVVPAERTSPRARRQFSVGRAGVFEVRDARDPAFRCWIAAGPGQGRVLRVDAQGAFRTANLADGEYTVKVYYEGTERASQPVAVAGREATVTVSLGAPAAPRGR